MNPKEAKKILPVKEYDAFENILFNQMSFMGYGTLLKKATLARKLRDKYKDLARHQVVETKSRLTNTTDTDIYDRKARLFEDILERIEDETSHPRFASASGTPRSGKKKSPRSVSSGKETRRALHEATRRTRSPSHEEKNT